MKKANTHVLKLLEGVRIKCIAAADALDELSDELLSSSCYGYGLKSASKKLGKFLQNYQEIREDFSGSDDDHECSKKRRSKK